MKELIYTGKGVYTISDIAAFTGARNNNIRNWIQHNGNKGFIKSEYGMVENVYGLSFLDLVEVMTINEFRKRGVSLQTVRKAYNHVRILFHSDRPFTIKTFLTDGRGVWAKINNDEGDPRLLDILSSQYELKKISENFLDTIDFSDNGISERWWPMNRDHPIVIDPKRSFGQPIVPDEGVPTLALAHTAKAEGSVRKAAHWYGVSKESAKCAYEYETNITQRVAA